MRRWKLVTVLVLGVLYMLACAEQSRKAAEAVAHDSSVGGVWYLQAVGPDRPIAGDVVVRFEFLAQGAAVYELSSEGPEEPFRFDLRYTVSDEIISIDSNEEDPRIPRLTGEIKLAKDGQTLHIQTHSDEQWVLTREAHPGGALESARGSEQLQSRADPVLVRVQQLAYAVGRYEEQLGKEPEQLLDLVDAGLVLPGLLTESGRDDGLPARYPRMTSDERSAWFSANSAFVLVGGGVADAKRLSVVVTTLPSGNNERVVVGMSNGSVHNKSAKQVTALLKKQGGALPDRWPSLGLSADAAAGLEPLGD